MKAIELSAINKGGQIVTNTNVFKFNFDKRLGLNKLIDDCKKAVAGTEIMSGYGTILIEGYDCAVVGFKIVDVRKEDIGRGNYVKLKDLSDFISVGTNHVKRLKERFAQGDFKSLKFSEALCYKR